MQPKSNRAYNFFFLFPFSYFLFCFSVSQPDSTDVVVFDNTYSYFKTKRIRYQVILSEPVSVDELEKGAAKLECE